MKGENGGLKAKEAAECLKARVETVRRMARRGEIPAFKLGKDWRFLLVRCGGGRRSSAQTR